MMKSLLFSLLTVCTINSALAENIQSIDTPVNWSLTALYNTVSHFHPNPEHYVDIVVDTYFMIINVHNREFIATPRELCSVYSVVTESIAQEPVSCYLLLEKLINEHNKEVETKINKDIITQDDQEILWEPKALHETVSHFHPNPEHYVDIVAETYDMITNVHNGEFIATPREMYAVYSVVTENIAQEPVFYYLFIERLKESQKYYDEKN